MVAKKRKNSEVASLPDAIPADFMAHMEKTYGDDWKPLVEALDMSPTVSLRVNSRKPLPGPLYEDMERVTWCQNGYYLKERPDFVHNPLLHSGAFYVQESASMIYEQIASLLFCGFEPSKTIDVLDLCAAPGGKTTALINALPDNSVIVANEIDRKRAGILKENLEKWGYPDIIITRSETEAFKQLPETFDLIAADVPCSGEGLMRREPIARTQWSKRLIDDCAALQRKIVGNAVTALKPGGYLIYSTCTFNKEENEENVKYFIENYDLEAVELPLQGIESATAATEGIKYGLHFFPHKSRCEGLFEAVLQKPEGSTAGHGRQLKKAKMPLVKLTADEKKWIRPETETQAVVLGNRIYALSPATLEMASKLAAIQGMNIISCGSEMFETKGMLRIPSSKFVLGTLFNLEAVPRVELNLPEALAYLKKEAVRLPEGTPGSYIAVTYCAQPLGLLKNLGTRSNNLYPAEWRLRT